MITSWYSAGIRHVVFAPPPRWATPSLSRRRGSIQMLCIVGVPHKADRYFSRRVARCTSVQSERVARQVCVADWGFSPSGQGGVFGIPPGISITGMLRRHSHLKLTGISCPRAPCPRPRPAAAPQEPLRYRWAKRAPRGAVHIQRVTLFFAW